MARSRRSISDIVAVVMLIIIAIAAAVLIYAWLSGLIGGVHGGNAGLYTKVEIVGGNISGPTSGTYKVYATVDNLGETTATINYMAVEFAANSSVICSTSSPLPSSSTTIQVDKSATLYFTCSSLSITPAAGTEVEIVVSTTDGITATYSTTWP